MLGNWMLRRLLLLSNEHHAEFYGKHGDYTSKMNPDLRGDLSGFKGILASQKFDQSHIIVWQM